MADSKLTEDHVAGLLTILRSDQSLDHKVAYVNTIKSGIKQHNVPDNCVVQVFEGLRVASTSQHAALVNAGFTALNHLLTRMSRQEPKYLAKEASRTLPVLVEKLGDVKDKHRSLALQGFHTFHAVAPADVERAVRNSALAGKNPRAKEAGMQWLVTAHNDHGLQFRAYVPQLMELLEDADGMVRDAAKRTVIELFTSAPNAAKSDLKRQLKNFKVRPAIEQAIIKALAPPGGGRDTPADIASSGRSATTLTTSSSATAVERPMTPGIPDPQSEHIEPQYVNTTRELDDIFREMVWLFDGKESEQNWLKREQSIITLRRLNAGNAATDFAEAFLQGMKNMLDGIIKAITSLRTSLSKEGCGLIQDVAIAFGPGMDPMVELLMQTLIKLSAGTKKISSSLADKTVDIIISRVTYTPRLMVHIAGAATDKNVQPRTYATGWLKTIIKKESHHKGHVEHSGGVDAMEKGIRKGLGDPNPTVREKMRSTYWAFHAVWPARANAIMDDLDSTAQKLLNKDPSNPNSPKKVDGPRPGMGLSRSTMTASKPSLRDAMLAQKKASLAAKNNLPARPGSAMAHISPVRNPPASKPTTTATSSSSSHPTMNSAAKSSAPTRQRQEGTISVNAGGMSVAPMRPVRRRPDVAVAPRPATAGPYSVRDGPPLDASSPESVKSKTPRPKTLTTPKRAAGLRPANTGHAAHASESSIASPLSRSSPRPSQPSPRISPIALKKSPKVASPTSPVPDSQDLTLVVPSISDLKASIAQEEAEQTQETTTSQATTLVSAAPEATSQPAVPVSPDVLGTEAENVTTSQPLKVFEDPLTQEDQTSNARPTFTPPVLEDKPVNENAAKLQTAPSDSTLAVNATESPDKSRQNARLLDSGIARIKARSLEVHGFRKLQSLIRDSKTILPDDKFEALTTGLFQYLEDPLAAMPADKAQDVKAQILATIRLLLKKERANLQPHVSKGLESLLQARSAYDSRAHLVSGLELLADELVTLGDGSEIVVVLTRRLQDHTDATKEGCRTLGMGLHVLKTLLDERAAEYTPSAGELSQLADLAGRCLDSADSGVRMDAVQLCVGLHGRVGEAAFWNAMAGVREDPKSLITYYIVKQQREKSVGV